MIFLRVGRLVGSVGSGSRLSLLGILNFETRVPLGLGLGFLFVKMKNDPRMENAFNKLQLKFLVQIKSFEVKLC